MLPVLQIGPLAVQLPGLLLIAGVWLGTMMIDRFAPRHGLSADKLNSMVFYALITGIIGARLGYALRFPSAYLEDPLTLLSLNTFTLSTPEGMLAGGLAALVYGRRRELSLWRTLDAITPSLALMTVTIALAHISSGDAYGAPTDLPWAIDLWGAERHPSQFYELGFAVLIGLLVWRRRIPGPFPGWDFLTWVGLWALARAFLEAFRGDSQVIAGSLRSAQVIGLIIAVSALWMLHYRSNLQAEEMG
jgi:prolipoprotein diacylglyceryl transferase